MAGYNIELPRKIERMELNIRRMPIALRLFMKFLLTNYVANVKQQKLFDVINNLDWLYNMYEDWAMQFIPYKPNTTTILVSKNHLI